jgi:uncharacterized Ntn-hydrolase superfamily protein
MTFSIVARCVETRSLGVATATGRANVRKRVPYVEFNVGAIATQGFTATIYGINGLKLLRNGLTPKRALEKMLSTDKEREKRQVIIIDRFGQSAAFTGRDVLPWKGHIMGKNYIVAGNMLANLKVLESMAKTFEESCGSLARRLLNALEAGEKAGGDKRGTVSAALIVAEKDSRIDLKVDIHLNPIKELRKFIEQI